MTRLAPAAVASHGGRFRETFWSRNQERHLWRSCIPAAELFDAAYAVQIAEIGFETKGIEAILRTSGNTARKIETFEDWLQEFVAPESRE